MPGVLNLTLYRGDSWRSTITILNPDGAPVALPASGWRAQVRRYGNLAGEFVVDSSQAAAGRITLSLPAEGSRQWPSQALWDLEQADTGGTMTWLAGTVTVEGDVTHD